MLTFGKEEGWTFYFVMFLFIEEVEIQLDFPTPSFPVDQKAFTIH